MLKIENLNIFLNEDKIVENLNLEIKKNEKIALIGKSGSGKTQIVKTIMRNSNLKSTGKIYIDNKEQYLIGKDVAMISQDFSQSLNPVLKIKTQMIEAPIYHKMLNKNDALKKAKDIFKKLNLKEEYLEKYPFELSGGEKQRVVIGIILMLEPKVLICDEISSGLDPLNEYEIIELINYMDITTIYITHSLDVLLNRLMKICYLKNSKLKIANSFEEFMNLDLNDEYILALKKVR